MTDQMNQSPEEWAVEMSDDDLFERMLGWADAELPRVVAFEVRRRYLALQATLRSLRPPDGGHDMLCDGGEPGSPDRWLDGSQDPFVPGMRAVKFVAGQGLVDDPEPRPPHVPYVGWCCGQATHRHIIDDALKDKP